MLTKAQLAKPISHEARAELDFRAQRIIKLESALEVLENWLKHDPKENDFPWALETAQRALAE